MPLNYPLGRIHPHGSGGKSVYQAAAAASARMRSRLGLYVGFSVLLLALTVIIMGAFSGGGALHLGALIAFAAALVLKREWQDYDGGSCHDASTPIYDRSNLPACDREFLQELEILETEMRQSAVAREWLRVLAFGIIFTELLNGGWEPIFEKAHPKHPPESTLWERKDRAMERSLQHCQRLYQAADRITTNAQKNAFFGSTLHYETGTGQLDIVARTDHQQAEAALEPPPRKQQNAPSARAADRRN